MAQGQDHQAALDEIEVVPSEDFNWRDARTSSVQGHRLLKRLGSGGYASVYLSERIKNGELFAMKIMKKRKIIENGNTGRTEVELRIHKQLDSPFIIKLIASFHTPTRVCMVLELAAKRNLQEISDDRHVPIYDVDIKSWLAEMVLGLEYLHNNLVMHRDMKRENMLLTSQGHIKISDFGISKEGMDKSTFTKTKCGTVPCMCPEMLMRIPYTRSADIWGLGIIALELFTGHSLFDTDDSQEIISKLATIKSCNELEYPHNLTGESQDFEFTQLSLSPKNMSAQINSTTLKDIQVVASEDFNSKDARTTSVKGFRLLKRIECGGFGIVFLGEHENEDQLCAVKVLNKWRLIKPSHQESVKRELRIHKELNHPFIIKMMAAFQTPTRLCFVLELAAQITMAELPDILRKEDIKHWLAEILQGLNFLHGRSVMHRDIKRENILLATEGHVKIGDFGFAIDGMAAETKAFEKVGTPVAMSPEIFKGAGYTRAADIWAFGVLSLELITAENLYGKADSNKIIGILKKMRSCDELVFPTSLTGTELDLVKGMLQFEENRISLEDVRDHQFFSGVEWNALLDYTFEDAPYQLPRKENSNKPIILEDRNIDVPFSFDDFEFNHF